MKIISDTVSVNGGNKPGLLLARDQEQRVRDIVTTIRKGLIFWDSTPCNVLETWWRLGGICLLNV
jgi:hypothetical protein